MCPGSSSLSLCHEVIFELHKIVLIRFCRAEEPLTDRGSNIALKNHERIFEPVVRFENRFGTLSRGFHDIHCSQSCERDTAHQLRLDVLRVSRERLSNFVLKPVFRAVTGQKWSETTYYMVGFPHAIRVYLHKFADARSP